MLVSAGAVLPFPSFFVFLPFFDGAPAEDVEVAPPEEDSLLSSAALGFLSLKDAAKIGIFALPLGRILKLQALEYASAI